PLFFPDVTRYPVVKLLMWRLCSKAAAISAYQVPMLGRGESNSGAKIAVIVPILRNNQACVPVAWHSGRCKLLRERDSVGFQLCGKAHRSTDCPTILGGAHMLMFGEYSGQDLVG